MRAGGKTRLQWVLRFNLGVNLCHLGRFGEAAEGLPELRRLSAALGNRTDAAKVRWLGGRVAVGLSRRDEARAAFEEARDTYAACEKGLDTALVSLDLALLLLEDGSTAAVREIAAMMAWVFQAEGIEREALAALRLFVEAALQERATLKETRRVLAIVRASEPGLRGPSGAPDEHRSLGRGAGAAFQRRSVPRGSDDDRAAVHDAVRVGRATVLRQDDRLGGEAGERMRALTGRRPDDIRATVGDAVWVDRATVLRPDDVEP